MSFLFLLLQIQDGTEWKGITWHKCAIPSLVSCFTSRQVFFQAEDGIRDAQESRGLGDVYKRQGLSLIRDNFG